MADVLKIGYMFIFILINTCNASLPGYGSLAENGYSGVTQGPHKQHVENVEKLMVHHPRYKCYDCESTACDLETPDTCTDALACFKSSVRTSDGELIHSRGCSDQDDHIQFICRSSTSKHQGVRKRQLFPEVQLNVSCCVGDWCNEGEFPALRSVGAESSGAARGLVGLWAGLAGAALLLAALLALALFFLHRTHRLRVSRAALHKLGSKTKYFNSKVYNPQMTNGYFEAKGGEGSVSGGGCVATAAGDSTLREYLHASQSSGSGSGLPLMVQRTLAKQVTLYDAVGKGRYGEVWRGSWYGDSVAVKIFFSRDEASWRRETEMYSTVMLRHENILAYIGSDMTSRGSCTQLWLITQYHPLGSLYEHLHRAVLSRKQMLVLCLSTVNGLLHLHTQIHGTQGKPAIAHRDIKTKNILVKVNGECCIADLGLAVTNQHIEQQQHTLNPRQGTRRYMSPEMLEQTMNTECLESYLRCDVYALGLVLWEVCSRVAPAAPYLPPYAPLAPPDPTHQHMRELVSLRRARPVPPPHAHPTMIGMAKLMQECWLHNPSARLPALRIKKTLLKLAAADESIQLNDDNEISL